MFLVKKQEKSLLPCSWGWIKTPAESLEPEGWAPNTTSGESGLLFNHQTESNVTVGSKSQVHALGRNECRLEGAGGLPWAQGMEPSGGGCFSPLCLGFPALWSKVVGGISRASPRGEIGPGITVVSAREGRAEPWQESRAQSTAGICCNPVKPVTQTGPSSPAVSIWFSLPSKKLLSGKE